MLRFRPLVFIAAIALILTAAAPTPAEPREGNLPPDRGDWTLSNFRVHEMPECTVLHTTFETTFDQMAQVGPIVEDLVTTVAENHIQAEGYVLMIYKGVQMDHTKPFQLSIAMVVPPGTKPIGKYEIRQLGKFKTASALFNGPYESIPNAYQKHYGELTAAGHLPTDETRELHLYFDRATSSNNVVWIQAGIQ